MANAKFKKEIFANTSFEETRIAILEDGKLAELFWERRSSGNIVGNIYKAEVDAFMTLKNAAYEKVKPSGERKMLDARTPVLAASFDRDGALLKVTLRLEPGRGVKPEIVAEFMCGGKPVFRRIVRKELYWFNSGGKLEVF